MLPLLIWRDDFKPAVPLAPLDLRPRPDIGPEEVEVLADVPLDLGERLDVDHEQYAHVLSINPETGNSVVLIPQGRVTDLSSERWWMTPILGAKSRRRLAGAAHDDAYFDGLPRDVADRIWWILARSGEQRVGRVRAFIGWAGLRMFGWRAYRRHARERAKREGTA